VVRLSHTRICFSCLARSFPGWPDEWIQDWLLRQAAARLAQNARMERRQPEGWQLELRLPEGNRDPVVY
jgi:hypothetical protein